MNAEGLKVWILMFVSIGPNGPSRAQPIPCSSLEKLKAHAAQLIHNNLAVKRLDKTTGVDKYVFDANYRSSISESYEKKSYDEAINTWRAAQMTNSQPLPFDLYWDEDGRPDVVL